MFQLAEVMVCSTPAWANFVTFSFFSQTGARGKFVLVHRNSPVEGYCTPIIGESLFFVSYLLISPFSTTEVSCKYYQE